MPFAPSRSRLDEQQRRWSMQKLSKDLTVNLGSDKPGVIAKATDAIAKAGVNMEGYAAFAGVMHVLTDDAPTTRRALEEAGLKVSDEREVVVTDVEHRPGTAASIFRRIADAGVNVDFSYVGANNRVVVGAKDVKKLTELFSLEAAGARR
jgi:hypothetical protein